MASVVGANWSCDSVDCAVGVGDGYAFSTRLARDRNWITSGATVLLGPQWNHVCDWIGDDGLRGANIWIPSGDVDGKRVLPSGRAGITKSISCDGEELSVISGDALFDFAHLCALASLREITS